MSYEPRPIDTTGVALTAAIEVLIERLAESNHDNWAARRLSEGWRYGSHRDDHAKTHPDLVPYERMSESEKDYDRLTVRETVKAILALGFEIRRPAS